MTFINLTPHEIHEVDSDLVIPPAPIAARVFQCSKPIQVINGITIFRSEFQGAIQNLPNPRPNTIYIVSALALNAVPSYRTDVVAPGNAVRDNDGKVIGCSGFRTR